MNLAEHINAEFIPIELLANPDALRQRCQTEYRHSRGKLANPDELDKLLNKHQLITLEHQNKLTVDVTNLTEDETFEKILNHLEKFN